MVGRRGDLNGDFATSASPLMHHWPLGNAQFKYQLGDWTMFTIQMPLQIRMESLADDTPPIATLTLPVDERVQGSQGFMIRGQPISAELPTMSTVGKFVCYVPLQYDHAYVDLRQSFEQYQAKFSSKTRSTINRKIKKFAEHCDGMVWKAYTEPHEVPEFLRLARQVSKLTYQEQLLDAGIPNSNEFLLEAQALAADQKLRAYLLFDRDKPVSYLCCPVRGSVVVYAYQGYDPAYQRLSVGTVLQWLALGALFAEGRFTYFDFTEGRSEHKRMFSTHQRRCAVMYFLSRSPRNYAVVIGHFLISKFSQALGALANWLGIKVAVKRILRFGTIMPR